MGEFGQRLRQEREKKGISLDEVALATKIGTRMLRAIEEEQFSRLPGGIFNKGFVRAYAKHLGLNEEQTVADYLAALNATLPQPPALATEPEAEEELPEIQASARRPPAVLSWGRLAGALLVVAVALGFWNLRSRRAAPEPAPAVTRTPPSPVVVPSAPKQEPQPSQQIASDATGSAKAVAASRDSGNAVPMAKVNPPDGLFHVLVRAREDSWLLVTADGKEIMQDTLLADGQRYIAAEKEIVIKSGNVGGLEFWFNDRRLPAQGDLDQVKTLTFDAHGLVAPTASVQAPVSGGVSQP